MIGLRGRRLGWDLGYAVGAVLAGVLADRFGYSAAIAAVAALTFASGLVAARLIRELGHPGEAFRIPKQEKYAYVAVT